MPEFVAFPDKNTGDLLTAAEVNELKEVINSNAQLLSKKYTDLTDTPGDYSGKSLQMARVNEGANGMEFAPQPVTFRGEWIPGGFVANDMVNDRGWLMVANKPTTDKAGPIASGPSEALLPTAPTWSEASQVAIVKSGHIWTFTKNGFLTTIRVWVTTVAPNHEYFLLIKSNDPVVEALPLFNLQAGQWNDIVVGFEIFSVGAILETSLVTVANTASTEFNGKWIAQGDTTEPPAVGEWGRDKHDSLSINKTDNLSGDRTAELALVGFGSRINAVEDSSGDLNEYLVTGLPVDNGTYFTYPVSRIQSTGNIDVTELTTLSFAVPTQEGASYVFIADFFPGGQPSFADVQAVLEFDGADQSLPNNAFGVDIIFQEAALSEDWDFAAYTQLSTNPQEPQSRDLQKDFDQEDQQGLETWPNIYDEALAATTPNGTDINDIALTLNVPELVPGVYEWTASWNLNHGNIAGKGEATLVLDGNILDTQEIEPQDVGNWYNFGASGQYVVAVGPNASAQDLVVNFRNSVGSGSTTLRNVRLSFKRIR